MSATIKYKGVEATLDFDETISDYKWNSFDESLAVDLNFITSDIGKHWSFSADPNPEYSIAKGMVEQLGKDAEIISVDEIEDDDSGFEKDGTQRIY